MNPLCYSANGMAYRYVDPNYQPQNGEVIFQVTPTVQQLTAAFPGYAAAATFQANMDVGKAALKAGLGIVSTSTPGLNGVYGVTPASQQNYAGVIAYILVNNRFPGGLTELPWSDMAGSTHFFNDVATFKAMATAIADYATLVTLYSQSGGQAGSLPPSTTTII